MSDYTKNNLNFDNYDLDKLDWANCGYLWGVDSESDNYEEDEYEDYDGEEDSDDFGYYQSSSKKVIRRPKQKSYCNYPSDHKFEKKILATHYYRECIYCGYSPDLDGDKENFRQCHKEFKDWENK